MYLHDTKVRIFLNETKIMMENIVKKIKISPAEGEGVVFGGNWLTKKLWKIERGLLNRILRITTEQRRHGESIDELSGRISEQDKSVAALTEEVSATSEEVSRHNDYFAPRAWVGDVEKASDIGIGQISAEVNDDGSFELRVRDKTIIFKPGEQPQALVNLIRGEVTEGTTSMSIAGKECKIVDGKFEVALGPDISFNGLFASKPIKSISSMNCDWLKGYPCRAMFNASKLETFDHNVMPAIQIYESVYMFANCIHISSIDFSFYKDVGVADGMFASCRANYINLSGVLSWDTCSAKNMFNEGSMVETLVLSDCVLLNSLGTLPHTLTNIYGPIKHIESSLDFSLCSKLTVESIREVFSALGKDLDYSVRLHPEAYNRLSAEDKAIATSKGWSIVRTVTQDLVDQ